MGYRTNSGNMQHRRGKKKKKKRRKAIIKKKGKGKGTVKKCSERKEINRRWKMKIK